MKSGTMWGIHAESSSQAVPLMRRYQAAGVQIAAILAHENPGLCTDAKRINPAILTIARWHNPNHRWEGGQDVASWTPAERADFAAHAIQLIFDRTNAEEYQASDYFCPGLNEWDPPELNADGYRAMAEVLKLLCQEATRRSPEMEARGLHAIRLAIPGFNSGTPEWNEMQAMVATGLFELMRARGDILILHEGVWWEMAIDTGHGDLIPGAPAVPPGGGSLCGRFNYWYSLGVQVPFVVTEWYDGNKRDTPPAKRLAAMKWYDRLARANPYCRGFCPFELTDVQDGPWWLVDFTPTFLSDALLADMLAERDKPNPLESDDMDAQLKAEIKHHAQAILDLVEGRWWAGRAVPFDIPAPNKALTFYHADGSAFTPPKMINVTWVMKVDTVSGDLLRVSDPAGTANDLWVRGADITP